MASKPASISDYKEIEYSKKHWILLNELRDKANRIMLALEASRLQSVTYGSIARGDVTSHSDVDVFVGEVQSSFLVESTIEKAGFKICKRLAVQATPNYAMKANLEIDDTVSVSFPLMPMRRVEREFYIFGGIITLKQIKDKLRVKGIDKRLMLIEPTEKGHVESSIIGKEEQVASDLGISCETVSDRMRTLLRRNAVGRTGVFVKKELRDDETFEMILKRLTEKNPAVRRRSKET
jgi:predicted nucleotidyltransferase